jgi:hypothetical protein
MARLTRSRYVAVVANRDFLEIRKIWQALRFSAGRMQEFDARCCCGAIEPGATRGQNHLKPAAVSFHWLRVQDRAGTRHR